MAKRNSDQATGSEKAKIRVFYAEVEGNNDSIQEALKTMVSAMGRPARVIVENRSDTGDKSFLEQGNPTSGEVEDVLEEIASDEDDTPPISLRKPRGTGKKIDRNAGLSLIPNLNFRPNGHPTLGDFLKDKRPKNDTEAVLAVTYYMQHHMGLNKISPSHVMTAFRDVTRSIPVDLKQTVRNLKSKRIFLDFNDLDDFHTTTQGDNFVEHKMGKAEQH